MINTGKIYISSILSIHIAVLFSLLIILLPVINARKTKFGAR